MKATMAVVIVLIGVLFTNRSEAKFEPMADQGYYKLLGRDIGRFGYAGGVKEFIEASPCVEQKYKAELTEMIENASSPTEMYLLVLKMSGLPWAEKERLKKLADGRGFVLLEQLIRAGAPTEFVNSLKMTKTYAVGELRDGDVCKCMSFTVRGVHKMRNIVYSGNSRTVLVFETKKTPGGKIAVVLDCNNGCIAPAVALTAVHVPAARPTVTQQLEKESAITPRAIPRMFKIEFHLWPNEGLAKEFATSKFQQDSGVEGRPTAVVIPREKDKRQSRDIDAAMIEAYRRGEITHAAGCYRGFAAEFMAGDWETAKGTQIWRTVTVQTAAGKIVVEKGTIKDIGAGNSTFDIDICDGVGALWVSTAWFPPGIAMAAHAPTGLVSYPNGGVLYSCAPATTGICGHNVAVGEDELYDAAQHLAVVRVHFVCSKCAALPKER